MARVTQSARDFLAAGVGGCGVAAAPADQRDGDHAAATSARQRLGKRTCTTRSRRLECYTKSAATEQRRRKLKMMHVLGIDAGGTKTVALLADADGQVVAKGARGGANLQAHGELEVEKVLHAVIDQALGDRADRPGGRLPRRRRRRSRRRSPRSSAPSCGGSAFARTR